MSKAEGHWLIRRVSRCDKKSDSSEISCEHASERIVILTRLAGSIRDGPRSTSKDEHDNPDRVESQLSFAFDATM
jgi:hypothetical protein